MLKKKIAYRCETLVALRTIKEWLGYLPTEYQSVAFLLAQIHLHCYGQELYTLPTFLQVNLYPYRVIK